MTLREAYEVLGLSRDATATQVKSAYRRRVSEAHPDRGGEAAEFIKIRAAYEILSSFLTQSPPEDDIPIPTELRRVIDDIVNDFREHQHWAESETLRQMDALETSMTSYIASASRSELRQFSTTFRNSWDAILNALFYECNTRCDAILKTYESWYTESTQAVFDDMYRKELLRFAWRRRFWEIFVVLGAIAGAMTVAVGWGGSARRWISVAMIVLAFVVSFFIYRWSARRRRKVREKVEPLSVVPFELQQGARFRTESTMRRGRRTTAAMGLAGMFLGNAASGGIGLPIAGAVAGAAIGGAFDRLINPTGKMRAGMQADLSRFMQMARPQVVGYVLEAHQELLEEIRGQVVANYEERVRGTLKLLTAGSTPARRPGRGATRTQDARESGA